LTQRLSLTLSEDGLLVCGFLFGLTGSVSGEHRLVEHVLLADDTLVGVLLSAFLRSLFIFLLGEGILLLVMGTGEGIKTEVSVYYALEETVLDEELFEPEVNGLHVLHGHSAAPLS
jgi:hypothetical protein